MQLVTQPRFKVRTVFCFAVLGLTGFDAGVDQTQDEAATECGGYPTDDGGGVQLSHLLYLSQFHNGQGVLAQAHIAPRRGHAEGKGPDREQ